MNKTGIGLVGKILLAIVLIITFLSGLNNIFIGLTITSLVKVFFTSNIMMRIIYVLMSLTTLTTTLILFIKVFIKKE